MMPLTDRRTIAHTALCLAEPPYLKHYRDGRFRLWNGVALVASELPGPGFNFAAVLHPCTPVARRTLAGGSRVFLLLRPGLGDPG